MEHSYQSTGQNVGQFQLGMLPRSHSQEDKKVTQRRNCIVTLCWGHQYPRHAIVVGGFAKVRDNGKYQSSGCLEI